MSDSIMFSIIALMVSTIMSADRLSNGHYGWGTFWVLITAFNIWALFDKFKNQDNPEK